jgi:hypothetical protein
MRLFNFNLSAVTYTSDAQSSEVLTQAFSTHKVHSTNPVVAGFVSLRDDLNGTETTDQGHYGSSHDSTSLAISGDSVQSFSLSLTSEPVSDTASGTTDDITADIMLMSNAKFGG